jgi:energy-coupling factor transporter ATP-binding protein EcfA2
MGQILALSLRDHPHSEASTISNFQARRDAGAFQEEAANEAQGLTDAAINTACQWVEVARGTREAQDERKPTQKMREDAERTIATANENTERAQTAVDGQPRGADAADALAERLARATVEEARKAKETKEEANRRLKECIQPVVTPSLEELAAAKRRIQYREDCFHFAVAGISGSGKSSLVNAFRGLRRRDVGAAAVGVTERALQVTRYPDANPENPFVWYEIPGAGAVKRHDWQYFIDQGLFVFESIVILFDNRFTLTDIAILANARHFNIPTYIVRSKADCYIQNIMLDMGCDSDHGNEDAERRNELFNAARKQFIEETRKSVRANLENANLPDQRVYIVSSNTLLSIVRKKTPKKTIDEVELLHDLFSQVCTLRVALDEIST